jgi:GMP synthase (glutamine-hydrolysing)
VDDRLFDLESPMLGICYGMQHMALSLGGEVGAVQIREYGRSDLIVKGPRRSLRRHAGRAEGVDEPRLPRSSPPRGFRVSAETPSGPIIAF